MGEAETKGVFYQFMTTASRPSLLMQHVRIASAGTSLLKMLLSTSKQKYTLAFVAPNGH